MVGIEPTTYGLRNRCSTTELHWRHAGHLIRGEKTPVKVHARAAQRAPSVPRWRAPGCGRGTGGGKTLTDPKAHLARGHRCGRERPHRASRPGARRSRHFLRRRSLRIHTRPKVPLRCGCNATPRMTKTPAVTPSLKHLRELRACVHRVSVVRLHRLDGVGRPPMLVTHPAPDL